MTETQHDAEWLIADESGAVYAVPTAALAPYRLSAEQLAGRAAGRRTADDEVGGYHHGGYTVQPGDSLWQIAQRIYGDGRAWVYLYGANADQIGNPNVIHPGQVLRLG